MTTDTDCFVVFSVLYGNTKDSDCKNALFQDQQIRCNANVCFWLILSSLYYRDVQASSVLLDDKFDVRLGSLSEVCPQEGEGHQNVITKLLRFSS